MIDANGVLLHLKARLDREEAGAKDLMAAADKQGKAVTVLEARSRWHTLGMVKVWITLAEKEYATGTSEDANG